MGIFGAVFGTKVKDPVLDELRKEENLVFGLNKEELAYGVNTINQLSEAEVIIKSAMRNSDDLLHMVMMKKPFPHDFDWEDVAGEFKDASRILNKARHSSFTFSNDLKKLTQALFHLDELIQNNFASFGHREHEDVALFKNFEFKAMEEFPPLDHKVQELEFYLERDVYGYLADLDEHLTSDQITHVKKLVANINKDLLEVKHRAERFNKILHNLDKRMRILRSDDKELESKIRRHLIKVRDEIRKSHEYKAGSGL